MARLLDRFHLPETIVQVVTILHTDSLVDLGSANGNVKMISYRLNDGEEKGLLHIIRGQGRLSDGQGMILALGHDGHHRTLVHFGHACPRGRQSRAHDVRTAQHKPDGTLVDLFHRQEERVLVVQPQGWHP